MLYVQSSLPMGSRRFTFPAPRAHLFLVVFCVLLSSTAATKLRTSSPGSPAVALQVPGARAEPFVPGPPAATEDQVALGWGILAILPLAVFAAIRAFLLLVPFPDDGDKVAPENKDWICAMSTAAAMAAVAIDSTASSVVAPLLPALGEVPGGSAALFFARPAIGALVTVFLPLILCTGSRAGRLTVAAGLALLTASLLMLAEAWASKSFSMALMARGLGATASGLTLAPMLHALMLQEPVSLMGWRLTGAVYGVAAGAAAGPILGATLERFCGVPPTLACLAILAICTCCVHLVVSGWVLYELPLEEEGTPDREEADVQWRRCAAGDFSSLLAVRSAVQGPLCALARSAQHRVLLVGTALCAATLSLHSILIPLLLAPRASEPLHRAPPAWMQGPGGALIFGGALLLAGLCSDRLLRCPKAIATLLVTASMGASLGLRAIVMAHEAGRPGLVSMGLVTTNLGLGSYLGLALPFLARLALEEESVPPAPGVASVFSAAIGVALLLGEGLGAASQLMLSEWLGRTNALLAFSFALGLHTLAVLSVPGWVLPDLSLGDLGSSPRKASGSTMGPWAFLYPSSLET